MHATVQQDVELASAIAGDPLVPGRALLPVDPAVETWRDRGSAGETGPTAALISSPGAGWGAKRWPAERYAAPAVLSLIERGFRVLVNAGPGEEPVAEVILRRIRRRGLSLSPTLAQLVALTRRIALATKEKAAAGVACALGRPVAWNLRPRPTQPLRTVRGALLTPRSPQSRRDHTRRDAPKQGLGAIQPEDVLRAADALLST